MRVYRIAQEKYARDLSGEGARRFGGRWNRKGVSMLYTAENSSLAMLEKLVHIPPYVFPKGLKILVLEFDDTTVIEEIHINALPSDWMYRSEHSKVLDIGDQFIAEGKYMALKVPSAINTIDNNVLINPRHPDFLNVQIIDELSIEFDKRLLREV
ncbi:RES family NAD+ phosphorylase [Dokdonia sp.]|uniref:RES family NAD+ phosphorylase n=1 Tax=Dokdonia sp. TaxID=2024995 RepID=UPI003262CCCC